MTTTTFELDGYQIDRQLGVVRGIVVRSRSLIGTIGGMLQKTTPGRGGLLIANPFNVRFRGVGAL